MTRIFVKELIWDEWNRSHINKHKVSEDEVADAGQHVIFHKQSHSRRYIAFGRSGRRLLAIILSRKGDKAYYLITARDASKKEKKEINEKEK